MIPATSLLHFLDFYDWKVQSKDKIYQDSQSSPSVSLPSTPKSQRDLKRVAEPKDLPYISPIEYVYDPVPEALHRLTNLLPLSFPHYASANCEYTTRNSVRVNPRAAGLPYRSRFELIRGNKHWKANLDETRKMLELIAVDSSSTSMEMRNGFTLAGLAKKELRPGLEHRVVLATSYMYPNANERRARIIAAVMLMLFIFDAGANKEKLMNSREQFLCHFRSPNDILPSDSVTSDFQRHLKFTVSAIADEDEISGNGGKEMIEALLGAFRYVHPKGDFHSLEEYLNFRRSNVGAQFVIAAAKFTIKSSVNVHDPRFARYLRLISDHLGIINDMASYEKESRALKEGDTQDMINIVAVFQHLKSLSTSAEAKVAAYTYQLQVESWIIEEVEILAARGHLTDEEWWFLEAVFMTATGNVFFCMTSSRYGGDAAKLTW
ncbi:uncharacterized protein EAF02_006039 [Botrytis sinoallii]|uniref:uncharacterized protein n=1 Tax=Botrytis sinoallii TaxID=1463999 RepID=UPI001901259A|nr:uncharacterized protein EAF02_006039 [Botrytis sinoallii]KAF7882676.1 hypothetical protein EAF02_006039 [Botrytis sinoallii]